MFVRLASGKTMSLKIRKSFDHREIVRVAFCVKSVMSGPNFQATAP